MKPKPTVRRPSAFRQERKVFERFVVVLGGVAAVVLVWASFVVGRGAEGTARLALANAVEEWKAVIAREGEAFDAAAVEVRFEFDPVDLDVLALPADEQEGARGDAVFWLLLREARRVGSDEAFAAARGAAASPVARDVMVLADLQRELAAGESEAARARWAAVATSVEGGTLAREEGVPVVVLAALALSEAWNAEERAAAAARIEGFAGGVFAFGAHARDFAGAKTQLALVEARLGARLAASRARLDAREALGAWAAEVSIEGGLDAERLRALAAGAGDVPTSNGARRLRVEVMESERGSLWRAVEVELGALQAAFLARLARHPVWGDDVRPVAAGAPSPFGDDGADGAEPTSDLVLAGFALAEGVAVDLWHRDADAFVAGETARSKLLRGALFALGVGFLGAGLVGSVALRRQRELTRLKSEFVAKVSHELRTPVAGILLAAEGLERARSPERTTRYVGLLHREAQRLERLVANVLDFSRLERGRESESWLRLDGQPASEAVAALVLATLERGECPAFALRIDGRGVFQGALPLATTALEALELRVPDTDRALRLDRDALVRVLLNLVDNAVQHGAPADASARWRVTLDIALTQDQLTLAVEDDGPGVAPAEQARIFEAFHQAARSHAAAPHKGAGLGLSIVREIVLGHGGALQLVPAASGRLARFEVCLPLVPPPESLA